MWFWREHVTSGEVMLVGWGWVGYGVIVERAGSEIVGMLC